MMAFRTTIDLCSLLELPYTGSAFTWTKNRRNPQALKERLDWVFINKVWNDSLNLPQVSHLDYYGLDHRAILSVINLQSISNAGNLIDVLNRNLSDCATDLRSWHRDKFGSLKQKISSAQADVTALFRTLQHHPIHMLSKNTKFFHAKASARYTNNKIRSLTDDNGTVYTSKDDLSGLVASYFENLFQAQNEDHWALQHVLNVIPTTVTAEHNAFLLKDFTAEGVFEALKIMNGDGSPGIDGMSTLFYQDNWHIDGNLVHAVLHVLNEGGSPEALNKTLITLIPKSKKSKTMKDFRPISLCNVVYKLISKSLVIPLKKILPHVISETQSAFLPNSLITDNILVAFELVHCLKHKTRGKKGFSTLKLDMSNAFDRVEWSFIAAVMGNSIFTPMFYTGNTNNCVVEYITPDREWNFSKLSADFSSVDMERVLSLPLSNNVTSDYWIWHYTGGEYNVKSRYHFACSLANDTIDCFESKYFLVEVFWNLKMAPKVMIFAWTAIQNALPVPAELFKKKSLTSASCSLCLNAWEFVGHAMFSCKHARQVWKIVGFAFNYKAAVSMKAEDFLFQLSECYTKSELETIFCTMWSIWSDRNNVIHGKLAQQPTTIFAKAQNFLNNYKSSQQLSLPTSLSPAGFPSTCKVWKPPPPNCLKLNVDVAFNGACHKIGFRAIIRDSNGIVKAAMSHPINGCCQPQEMEAKGLFYSLKWARQFNFKVDTVEIDSLILANAPHKATSN
uniref:Reverse transcriptase domain-containing protein n=1 Tax=Cannabis sativa TaxID=3483 RepID=A0A803PZ39_CANSA